MPDSICNNQLDVIKLKKYTLTLSIDSKGCRYNKISHTDMWKLTAIFL